MRLDGLLADPEVAGDLLVGLAASQRGEDLALARRELGGGALLGARGEHGRRGLGRQRRLACRRCALAADELVSLGVLVQEANNAHVVDVPVALPNLETG